MSEINGTNPPENHRSSEVSVISKDELEPAGEADFSTATTLHDNSHRNLEGGLKKSKYADSKWKQQRIPGWKPLMEFEGLWPAFLFFGLILIAIGLFNLFVIGGYKSVNHDYTNCKPNGSNESCSETNKANTSGCICTETINIPADISGRVTISYELTEFYQNQRPYLMSRDNKQLLGRLFDKDKVLEPDEDCEPFRKAEGRIVYPCGRLANSFFTDEIALQNHLGEEIPLQTVPQDTLNKIKFALPSISYTDEKFTTNFIKPGGWSDEVWEKFWKDGGVTGDDFSWWMRPAAFSDIRKPYRTFEGHVPTCSSDFKGLCKGLYQLNITYRFDTASFGGTKTITISNSAILNDSNHFFFLGYLVAGGVLICLGFLSCICNRISRRSKVQPEYFNEFYDSERPDPSNVPQSKTVIVDDNQAAGLEIENKPSVGNEPPPPNLSPEAQKPSTKSIATVKKITKG